MAKINLKNARIDERFEGDLDMDELMFNILFTFGINQENNICEKIEDIEMEE